MNSILSVFVATAVLVGLFFLVAATGGAGFILDTEHVLSVVQRPFVGRTEVIAAIVAAAGYMLLVQHTARLKRA